MLPFSRQSYKCCLSRDTSRFLVCVCVQTSVDEVMAFDARERFGETVPAELTHNFLTPIKERELSACEEKKIIIIILSIFFCTFFGHVSTSFLSEAESLRNSECRFHLVEEGGRDHDHFKRLEKKWRGASRTGSSRSLEVRCVVCE